MKKLNYESKEWKKAQENIAVLLSNNGFLVWHEKKIGNNRVDILAKRQIGDSVCNLIFEVKHYNNVSGRQEIEFEKQLQKYLKAMIKREAKRYSPKFVYENMKFIGYLVFTKDYGIHQNNVKHYAKKQPFKEDNSLFLRKIWERNVYVFFSRPVYIAENLKTLGLPFFQQTKITDFLD